MNRDIPSSFVKFVPAEMADALEWFEVFSSVAGDSDVVVIRMSSWVRFEVFSFRGFLLDRFN
jgi:hypothetical protein